MGNEIFQIYFTGEPLTLEENASAAIGDSVIMTAADGKKYVCTLPPAPYSSSTTSTSTNVNDFTVGGLTTTTTGGRTRNIDIPIAKLLEPLGVSCFYRVEGWWTYEFCHRTRVRQFHQEGDKITNEYNLGLFDVLGTTTAGDVNAATLAEGMEFTEETGGVGLGAIERYHAHVFTGGTKCDLMVRLYTIREEWVKITCTAYIVSYTFLVLNDYIAIYYSFLCVFKKQHLRFFLTESGAEHRGEICVFQRWAQCGARN